MRHPEPVPPNDDKDGWRDRVEKYLRRQSGWLGGAEAEPPPNAADSDGGYANRNKRPRRDAFPDTYTGYGHGR